MDPKPATARTPPDLLNSAGSGSLWLLVSFESVVPFETSFWSGQCSAPPSRAPRQQHPVPLGPSILWMTCRLSPSASPHASFKASFPDCHRHTDRQTDRQTGPIATVASTCACWVLPCRESLGSGVLIPLVAAPSWHSVHVGDPGLPAICPLGKGRSIGAHGYPRMLHREGRGGEAGTGSRPAGSVGRRQ